MVQTFSYDFWFGWGLLIFSLAALIFVIRIFFKNRAGRLWPTITARVTEKHLEEMTGLDNPGVNYAPVITYTYEVGGAAYTSNQYHPAQGRSGYSMKKAQGMLDSTGEYITIHYNPENPAESFMLQFPRWMFIAVIPICLFNMLWALTILFPLL